MAHHLCADPTRFKHAKSEHPDDGHRWEVYGPYRINTPALIVGAEIFPSMQDEEGVLVSIEDEANSAYVVQSKVHRGIGNPRQLGQPFGKGSKGGSGHEEPRSGRELSQVADLARRVTFRMLCLGPPGHVVSLVSSSIKLEFPLVLQHTKIFRRVNANSRAANVWPRQKLLIHGCELRSARHLVLGSVLIHLHAECQVYFVESDVGLLVLAASCRGHGVERALGHSRNGKHARITLRSGTHGPRAIRMVLLQEVADGGSIGDWNNLVRRPKRFDWMKEAYRSWPRSRLSYYSVAASW